MGDTSSPAAVAGQAEATTQARRYAWQTYLSWKEKNGESWESVVLEMEGHKGKDAEKELMGETIMVELIGLQEHLIEEDIKNRSNPNTSTSTDTLAQYFGQVKEMMKERYGSLDIWTDHEKVWYSDMRKRLKTGISRRLLDDNVNVNDLDTRPVVRRLKPSFLHLTHRQAANGTSWEGYWESFEGRDLVSMMKQLIRGDVPNCDNPFEWRLILVTLYLAGGRGGEPKHMKYNKMAWDEYFCCLTGVWTQVKQLNQKDVPFIADPEYYAVDIYHSWGCFIMEGGLRRPNPSDPRMKCIFPSLQSLPNEGVTRKVTEMLKKLSDEKTKKWTSAKSLRKAFNNVLAANPLIDQDKHRMLSGHSRGDTTDSYVQSLPCLTMPPARAIVEWPNPHEMVYPPTLDALGASNVEKVANLIRCLFYISPHLTDLRSRGDEMSYDTTASFSLSFFDAGDNARFASRGNFRTRKFGLRPKVLHFSTSLTAATRLAS